jgi:hypothetical protein
LLKRKSSTVQATKTPPPLRPLPSSLPPCPFSTLDLDLHRLSSRWRTGHRARRRFGGGRGGETAVDEPVEGLGEGGEVERGGRWSEYSVSSGSSGRRKKEQGRGSALVKVIASHQSQDELPRCRRLRIILSAQLYLCERGDLKDERKRRTSIRNERKPGSFGRLRFEELLEGFEGGGGGDDCMCGCARRRREGQWT